MALDYRARFCINAGPYDDVHWTNRDVKITEKIFDQEWKQTGERVVFYQQAVEAPEGWSDLAVQITAQKYFRGKVNKDGTPIIGRETSIRQLVDRVVDTIAGWAGYLDGSGVPRHDRTEDCDLGCDWVYFDCHESWQAWKNDLKWLLIRQYMWFNSPVWFNVGVDPRPQCSACFILRVNDQMSSGDKGGDFNLDDHGLIAWQVKEALIFTNGSGAGVNLSRIRSKHEHLSGGGDPTGPGSFAEGPDAWARCIKSGGKTRRAAKMMILDMDHPDIEDFIKVKAKEEKIAKVLIANGYPKDMDGEAYSHAKHQNSNLSVRAPRQFFEHVEKGLGWSLVSRTKHFLQDLPDQKTMLGTIGKELQCPPAKDLADLIASQCWESGDPGMQYSDTINEWHTCLDTEPIFGSNPCSEYLFLDETSCNLASLNLGKWFKSELDLIDSQRIQQFQFGVEALTIAMDVIVSGARYPTRHIRGESQKYRTLGVGYANLGGMLLRLGVPYDSDRARSLCAAITSLMTAQVYSTSAWVARSMGSFAGFKANKESFVRVMKKHQQAARALGISPLELAGHAAWADVVLEAEAGHARNAQASVLAPTGTIAFSMDAETTGIEPELGLIKYKQLAGGGNITIPNPLIETTLLRLGYFPNDAVALAEAVVKAKGAVRKVPGIRPEHYKVFETSNPPADDPDFYIPWEAHVKMMAAAQPFISGAISKTINMPNSATREEMWRAYVLGEKLGLKSIAIYRDGCKATQPLSTMEQKVNQEVVRLGTKLIKEEKADLDQVVELKQQVANLTEALAKRPRVHRLKPPKQYSDMERIKFEIDGHEGYMMAGFYPGTHDPCELFVQFSKPGGTVQGLTNIFCITISIMLQVGIPFEDILHKFEHIDFKPQGMTGDPDVHIARSVVDFAVRKLQAVSAQRGPKSMVFQEPERTVTQPNFGEDSLTSVPEAPKPVVRNAGVTCQKCGSPNVVLNKQCVACTDCGFSDGGCFG